MQTKRPKIDEDIAPKQLTFLEKRPHTKGPRNTEPIAPQEIPRIETIEAGLK